ncbi:ankyrin [Piromyces finnis]|uniref:Ankyrin n=1 Tax=Piromyces finnis TaxID=1754191 RepID=A0A1Y1UQN0_9FUNG|nr:ankyrin [Piromyces finnis]|eukprot:ORX40351.1 ankyrin [Piromyces finnis]
MDINGSDISEDEFSICDSNESLNDNLLFTERFSFDDNDIYPIIYNIEELKFEINNKDKDGYTFLHYACKKGCENIVKYLIDRGANVNATDMNNWTPLHYACEKGYENIVKYLIDKGADINIQNKDRCTPLHFACDRGNEEIVKYLIENEKIDVNSQDDNGWTPLHHACYQGNEEIVKYLIEKGADVNTKSKYGNIIIHFACQAQKENVNLVKYLIENEKIDVNIQDDNR